MERLGLLVGGGPAPGINGVIEAAVRESKSLGVRAIGLLDGFKWLSKGKTDYIRTLTLQDVEGIEHRGGSIIRTSRHNPTKSEEEMEHVLRSLKSLGIRYLITIGGDDTSHTARLLAERGKGTVSVAHVPKTIDNDLPLLSGVPTFGFETAREVGSELVRNLYEDAKTSPPRWYIVITMGRSAGFLGLSIALSGGAPLALIPEEFKEGTPLSEIIDIIVSSIKNRLSHGLDYGVAVISEGVAMKISPSDFEYIEKVGRDEHGNIKLAEVPLGSVLKEKVSEALSKEGIKMKLIHKDIGFELRCSPPNAFDREYTRRLGVGAAHFLIKRGGSGAMITIKDSEILPVPLEDIIDPVTGKTKVRRVDINGGYYRDILNLMR
ncbi:MAG: 6-phosphofructokinase [Nitrospirae bacterium]|nr:MAG: 6-phosphofructokinase [Nitrospirota bacterium]